jgi:hypothetical protein
LESFFALLRTLNDLLAEQYHDFNIYCNALLELQYWLSSSHSFVKHSLKFSSAFPTFVLEACKFVRQFPHYFRTVGRKAKNKESTMQWQVKLIISHQNQNKLIIWFCLPSSYPFVETFWVWDKCKNKKLNFYWYRHNTRHEKYTDQKCSIGRRSSVQCTVPLKLYSHVCIFIGLCCFQGAITNVCVRWVSVAPISEPSNEMRNQRSRKLYIIW